MYFEVRRTEFPTNMFEKILKILRSLMVFLKNYEKEEEARGIRNKWLDKDRIHLSCGPVDFLFTYRFHK